MFLNDHAKAVTIEYSTDKKLAVSAVAYFTTVGLLLVGKVPPSTYETVTMMLVGLYLGANVGQKWVEKGKGTNGAGPPAPAA